MRIILVRHPQPLVAPGLCYGSTDLAVAPDELARVGAALSATLPRDAPLFSSPLRRCADAGRQPALRRAHLRCAPRRNRLRRLGNAALGRYRARRHRRLGRRHERLPPRRRRERAADGGAGRRLSRRLARAGARARSWYATPARCACWPPDTPAWACRTMALHAARTPHQIAYGATLILDLERPRLRASPGAECTPATDAPDCVRPATERASAAVFAPTAECALPDLGTLLSH